MISTIMAISLILNAQLSEGCKVGCRSNFGVEAGTWDPRVGKCFCGFWARYDDTTGIYQTKMQPKIDVATPPDTRQDRVYDSY